MDEGGEILAVMLAAAPHSPVRVAAAKVRKRAWLFGLLLLGGIELCDLGFHLHDSIAADRDRIAASECPVCKGGHVARVSP